MAGSATLSNQTVQHKPAIPSSIMEEEISSKKVQKCTSPLKHWKSLGDLYNFNYSKTVY